MKNREGWGLVALLLVLLGVMVAIGAPGVIDSKVAMEWDYPASQVTNTAFTIYYSSDISKPLTNWARLTNVVGKTKIDLTGVILPGENFFVMTASNFWGESVFSNVASTPPLPRSDVSVRATK